MARYVKKDLINMLETTRWSIDATKRMRDTAKDRHKGEALQDMLEYYDNELAMLYADKALVERIIDTVYGDSETPIATITLTDQEISQLEAILHPYAES